MKFQQLALPGAFLILPEPMEDERGFFSRLFCEEEFRQHGLNGKIRQASMSQNKHRGTLRGLHFQISPYAENKIVRVTRGAIYDVIVDLRPESETFRKHLAFELTSANRHQLYVPEGFAHGFQTLEDNTEVFYQMTAEHNAGASRGFAWNDPAFSISWPLQNPILSPKDAAAGHISSALFS